MRWHFIAEQVYNLYSQFINYAKGDINHMKCPNCGAEQTGTFCTYCGTEMPKQPVNIVNNYYGNVTNGSTTTRDFGTNPNAFGTACPNCGSSNIKYERESTGTRGYHKTVGVCKNCGNTWVRAQEIKTSSKNRIVALSLCICLGYFGAHQFYAGKAGMGVLYFFTMGLFGIGWIIDIIRLYNCTFTDAYGYPLV